MISRAQGYAIHGIRGLVESFSSKGRIGAGTLTRAPDRDSRRLRTVAYRNLVRAVVAASEDSMKGKVVLVTGANGGLGTSVTKAFLDAGATVIGSSRKIQQADFESPNFTAIAADASTREGTKGLVDQVVAEFGKLNVLAHMVGGFAGGKSIADTDDAMFEQMMEMNLTSVFQMVRAAIPALRRSGSGRIIAIGSRAAVEPGANVGAYSVSKAAMVSLIKTVALENKGAGVTANVILPGTIDTPMNRKYMPNADFSKWVKPSTIAQLMVWLAGDAGRDVNGAVIPVFGGDF